MTPQEVKLQDMQAAGHAMVTPDMAGLSLAFERAAEPHMSSDYVLARGQSLKTIAEENNIMLDESSLAGLIQRNNVSSADQHKNTETQKGKKKSGMSDALWAELLSLEAQRQALLDDLENLQNRARELGEKLEDIERDMGDTRETLDAIDDAMKHFDEHGEFELNEDGSLKDERLEELLKAHEEKYGPVDRSDPAELHTALQEIRKREVLRLRELEEEHVKTREELDYTFDEMEKKREELDLKEEEIEGVREKAAASGVDLISEDVSTEEAADLVSDAENMFGAPSDLSGSFNDAAQDDPDEPSPETDPQEPQTLQDDGPVIQPM